jgi:hypothetical protein
LFEKKEDKSGINGKKKAKNKSPTFERELKEVSIKERHNKCQKSIPKKY